MHYIASKNEKKRMFIFSVKVCREHVDKKGGLICKKIEDIIIIESENVSLEDEEEKRKNNECNVQQVKKKIIRCDTEKKAAGRKIWEKKLKVCTIGIVLWK